MIPELFRVGSFAISPFGVTMVLAFLASYVQAARGFRRLGIGDEEDASAIVFAAGVGGILGGKIYYAALYGDWRLLLDRAGLVWYGGFLLAAALVAWVIRRRRLYFPSAADVCLLGVAIGYAIGRVGCFLVGDDYGMPTDQPWGVTFPRGLPPTTAGILRAEYGADLPADLPADALVAVHPTQLYETGLALAIWGLGTWMLRRGARPGMTALAVAALLACERLFIELFRAKDDRFLGAMTLAQAISVAILLVVAGAWLAWRRRAPDGPAARAAAA